MASTNGFLPLLFAAVCLLLVEAYHAKYVTITNTHKNYLSIRCFSFNHDEEPVKHMAHGEVYTFRVKKNSIYPSATMYNCSTNMGTFVAFKYDYQCSQFHDTCVWTFNETSASRYEPKTYKWEPVDYSPNYESLDRGGVIRGYFAN